MGAEGALRPARAESASDSGASGTGEARYRAFWHRVGDTFPDLGGAASTAIYREDEEALFREFLPPLEGLSVFKTDLWDEARNTRILCWAAEQGATAVGIDISPPVTLRAAAEFRARGRRLRAVVSDVRTIPWGDASFDAVYSMGTVEHFDETDAALCEIRRVLRPGGRAIVGVPNRLDPFLRPLLVAVLSAFGLYHYGYEKSYTRRRLRRMLEAAGFRVVGESGILFMPGWLRMLDLTLHSWAPSLGWLTGPPVRLFGALRRRFPGLRRHGYLLATVVERSDSPGPSDL